MGKAGSVAWDGFLTGLQFWEAEDPRDFGQRFGGDLMLAASAAAPYAKVPVYRVFGGSSTAFGQSWTMINPKYVPYYRKFAGLPDVNSGEWLASGGVKWRDIDMFRFARPLDGNCGGLPELIIKNARDKVKRPIIEPLSVPK